MTVFFKEENTHFVTALLRDDISAQTLSEVIDTD